jgi:hypothetical protein
VVNHSVTQPAHREDWAEAPDVAGCVGRARELDTLRRWVVDEQCRVVELLGMGGIGKTTVATRLAKDLAAEFELVLWRKVTCAPSPSEWLSEVICFLSGTTTAVPQRQDEQIICLIQLLRERRCLLVLDNFETLLEPGDCQGAFRDGYEGYRRVVQAVGERQHRSCLLLTSREAPPDLGLLAGHQERVMELGGLTIADSQIVLEDKQLWGTELSWGELVMRCGGNPLLMRMTAETIHELFDGDIGAFLVLLGSTASVHGGVRRLLASQIEGRLPKLEQDVLRVMAHCPEPLTPGRLLGDLGPRAGRVAVLDALQALKRRSLLMHYPAGAGFSVQPIVRNYLLSEQSESVGA